MRKTESEGTADAFPSGAAYRGGKPPKKWSFTARDIGEAVGLSPQQVLKLAGKGATEGGFDPTDLASLARFVVDRQGKADARTANAVLLGVSKGTEAACNALGISQATLYRRAKAHTEGQAALAKQAGSS